MAPRRQAASERAMESIDPRTRFLYTPHTVTFLLLGAPLGVPCLLRAFGSTALKLVPVAPCMLFAPRAPLAGNRQKPLPSNLV